MDNAHHRPGSWQLMRTDQYVYVAIRSGSISAEQITTLLDLEPDAVTVKASHRPDPPRPREHKWAIECRQQDLRIDEQVDRVLARLRPHSEAVRRLAQLPDVSVTLQMVRYFNDDQDGQDGVLGWHLSLEALEFLISISASIDSDEYGL